MAADVKTVCANPEGNQAWRTKPAFVDVDGNAVRVTFKTTSDQKSVMFLSLKQNTKVQNGVSQALKSGVLEKLVSSDPGNYPECYKQLCIRAVTAEEANALNQPAMAGQLGLFNGSQSVASQASAVSTKSRLGKKNTKRNTQLSSQASTSSGASGTSIIKAGQVFAVYGGVVYPSVGLPVGSNHLVCFNLKDESSNSSVFYVDGMLMPGGSANTIGEIKDQKFQEQVFETRAGNMVLNQKFNAIRVPVPAKLNFNATVHDVEVSVLVAIQDIAPGQQILCPYGWSGSKPVEPYFVRNTSRLPVDPLQISQTQGLDVGIEALVDATDSSLLARAMGLLVQQRGFSMPQQVPGVGPSPESVTAFLHAIAQQAEQQISGDSVQHFGGVPAGDAVLPGLTENQLHQLSLETSGGQ